MTERDYVLGTHDEEVERLGLQHRVWRPRALDAWRRAGFTVGQTLLDVGSGPGYATLDLAEIAGRNGRVVAFERSARFLNVLRSRINGTVDTIEIDLDHDDLPPLAADGAWVRWVFAFVKRPRALVGKLRNALRPGAALVIHEYFDYATWRFTPRVPEFEDFVGAVMESWRGDGGEPDIALDLPRFLEEEGFTIRELRPIIDVIEPGNYVWEWPRTFFHVGLDRLVQLGRIDPARAASTRDQFARAEGTAGPRMITPAVLEIIATR